MKPKIPTAWDNAISDVWPRKMNVLEVSRWVRSIHGSPQDFDEGDLLFRLNEHATYQLTEIPLDYLDRNEWSICEDLVDEYAAQGPSFPPIVLDPKLSIIDGTHRVNAALARGHKTIMAYVASNRPE